MNITPREAMLIIREEMMNCNLDNDALASEKFYKEMSNLCARNQALLEFARKTNSEIQAANYGIQNVFRATFKDKEIDIYFSVKSPTAIHQSVSINYNDYKNNPKMYIVFAIPQSSDPNYYVDKIPKHANEFEFYIVEPGKVFYIAKDINAYFRLKDLIKLPEFIQRWQQNK